MWLRWNETRHKFNCNAVSSSPGQKLRKKLLWHEGQVKKWSLQVNCNLGNCRRLLFTCENVFFSSQNETYFNTMLSYTKIYKNKRIDEESRKFRTTTEFESFVSLLLRDNTWEAMSYQLPMCWFQSSMVMARSEGNSLLPSVISWKVRTPNFSRKILILRFKRIIFLLQTILPLQN